MLKVVLYAVAGLVLLIVVLTAANRAGLLPDRQPNYGMMQRLLIQQHIDKNGAIQNVKVLTVNNVKVSAVSENKAEVTGQYVTDFGKRAGNPAVRYQMIVSWDFRSDIYKVECFSANDNKCF